MVVSVLHTVFDMLAFKNDIGFWKNNKVQPLSRLRVTHMLACQEHACQSGLPCSAKSRPSLVWQAGHHPHEHLCLSSTLRHRGHCIDVEASRHCSRGVRQPRCLGQTLPCNPFALVTPLWMLPCNSFALVTPLWILPCNPFALVTPLWILPCNQFALVTPLWILPCNPFALTIPLWILPCNPFALVTPLWILPCNPFALAIPSWTGAGTQGAAAWVSSLTLGRFGRPMAALLGFKH